MNIELRRKGFMNFKNADILGLRLFYREAGDSSKPTIPWHDRDPSREVASSAKGCPVADGRHGSGGDRRAEAGDLAQTPAARFFVADALALVGKGFDIDLHLLPLLPQALEQPAHSWAQLLLGIFQN